MTEPQDTTVDGPAEGVVVEKTVAEFVEQGPFRPVSNRAARRRGTGRTAERGKHRRAIAQGMKLQRTLEMKAALDPDAPAIDAITPRRRGRS